MSLYVIGDPHLSLATEKPMDVFAGWNNYVDRLVENWNAKITPQDTVVIAGDISWAMSLEESLTDLTFINDLPGQKLLVKGNHDYWWATTRKMESFFEANGLTTLKILHNNCAVVEDKIICGSRGWMMEAGEAFNAKIIAREAGRLEASFKAAEATGSSAERIAVLHYPPVYGEQILSEMVDLLIRYGVKRCYYGHVHGWASRYAIDGVYLGIDFRLIAGDFIGFDPVLIP